MHGKNLGHRYGTVSIVLHWLMAILIVAVYAFMELRGIFPKDSEPRQAMKAMHFMLGLVVLLMVMPRIVARLFSSTPAIKPEPPAWQQQSARIVHLALYVLMIAMPIAGWFLLSAAGKPIPFFGLYLPALIGEHKELVDIIKEIHETGGLFGYFLIGGHIIAVLFHHYIKRDNTLNRMLLSYKHTDRF